MAAGLTVGDFSRITHLSVKTLRHYHEVGLLERATVNPGTGYRYYCAAQVPTAQVITPVTVPAAELAVIGHRGSLADADLSYATLGSYATRHEISIDGPLREYYLRGAAETDGPGGMEDRDWLAHLPRRCHRRGTRRS